MWGKGIFLIDVTSDPGRSIGMILELYDGYREGENTHGNKYTKEDRRLFERLEYINYVCRKLKLTQVHKDRIRHIVINIEKLGDLCKKCKWETIITGIAFYVKCYYHQNCKINHIDRYTICKENDLTLTKYTTIITRLAWLFQNDVYLSPLCPTEEVRRNIKK